MCVYEPAHTEVEVRQPEEVAGLVLQFTRRTASSRERYAGLMLRTFAIMADAGEGDVDLAVYMAAVTSGRHGSVGVLEVDTCTKREGGRTPSEQAVGCGIRRRIHARLRQSTEEAQ